MKLSSDVILYELRNCNLIRCRGFDGLEFDGVRLTPGDKRWLCVCRGVDITEEVAALDCSFISVGEPVCQPASCAVFVGSLGLTEIHGKLQSLFDLFGLYEAELGRAAMESGYGAMVRTAWEVSHNPIVFMDGSLRVLALAPDWDYADDAEWTHMRTYGFASLEGLRAMREKGEFSAISRYDTPTLYSAGTFINPSIVTNINIDGTCVGRICMTGPYDELTPFDLKVTGVLAEYLKRKIQQDDSMRQGSDSDPVYSIFFDLIRGMKLESRLIASRIGGILGWNSGSYCALAVPAIGADEISYNYYSGLLERRLDCFCIRYEGGLAAVLHLEELGDQAALEATLAQVLQENGLAGGVSNWFEDITQLKVYYEQAAMALQYEETTPGVHPFSRCAMRHMLSFYPPEQVMTLAHPALFVLREHDKHNSAELYETLRVYLENERSLVKTAAALFIHRNTLLYRLEKLGQLVKLELDDPEQRLYLSLSFRLLDAVWGDA